MLITGYFVQYVVGNLGMMRRLNHEAIGGLPIKHQDHHLVLGPDLLSYHLGAADKDKANLKA